MICFDEVGPIEVRPYLERSEFAEMMACGADDVDALESNPRSAFNEVAQEIMQRYMTDIYKLTTVNFDHLFANIIRYQKAKRFKKRAYRNRIFLLLGDRDGLRWHGQRQRDFLLDGDQSGTGGHQSGRPNQ